MKDKLILIGIIVFGMLAIVGLVAILLNTYHNQVGSVTMQTSTTTATTNTTPATYTGKVICLPVKTGQPAATSCVMGLQTDDGHNCALTNLNQQNLKANARIKVIGTLAQPSATAVYDIAGVITVTTITYL